MECLVPRRGRQLQRYNEHGGRQVVGCIPYRLRSADTDDTLATAVDEAVEVLVISSQKGSAVMFPKVGQLYLHFALKCKIERPRLTVSVLFFFFLQGGWESDESENEAALREALEEAGVQGKLEVSCYHSFHCSPFWSRPLLKNSALCNVVVVLYILLNWICAWYHGRINWERGSTKARDMVQFTKGLCFH